jgi:hypothetical protein
VLSEKEKEYQRIWRNKNKEKIKQNNKNYHLANKEKLNEESRNYYSTHRIECLKNKKEYWIKNKEIISTKQKALRVQNKKPYAEDYRSIHKWARRNVPKQIICSICKQEKKLEVANISGEYRHDVSDYEWCCHSCHVQAHIDGCHKNSRFKFIDSEKDKIRKNDYYQRVDKKRKKNKYLEEKNEKTKNSAFPH